jgi:hypothetical protein
MASLLQYVSEEGYDPGKNYASGTASAALAVAEHGRPTSAAHSGTWTPGGNILADFGHSIVKEG